MLTRPGMLVESFAALEPIQLVQNTVLAADIFLIRLHNTYPRTSEANRLDSRRRLLENPANPTKGEFHGHFERLEGHYGDDAGVHD